MANIQTIFEQINQFSNKPITNGSRETNLIKYFFVGDDKAIAISGRLHDILSESFEPKSLLDLCYGSGCLSTHIANIFGFFDDESSAKIKLDYKVVLNDKKNFANTELNIADKQVYDVFSSEFTNYIKDDKFDLIIANFTVSDNPNNIEYNGGIFFNEDQANKLRKIIESNLTDNGVFLTLTKPKIDIHQGNYLAHIKESQDINFYLITRKALLDFEYDNNNVFEPKTKSNLDNVLDIDLQTARNNINVSIKNLSDVFKDNDYKKNYLWFTRQFAYKNLITKDGSTTQVPLNLILKGVPGTGKSRLISKIISNVLQINDANRVLRVNIHSASSNADLMQGIGIATTKENNIQYLEKTGLVLRHIESAIKSPDQEFVLVLEEIQENKLNELIGDLIYLIEQDKRTDITAILEKNKKYCFDNLTELVDELIKTSQVKVGKDKKTKINYVDIPYLIDGKTESRKLIFPANLYVFCTSNYRDDKKIIEDNLLRRFTLLELYPKYEFAGETFASKDVLEWLKKLNERIVVVMGENHETHPDRFMIGHAIFKGINGNDKHKFAESLLKIVTEFKDIREIDFKIVKEILGSNELLLLPFEIQLNLGNYKTLIDDLQNQAGFNSLFDENNYQSSNDPDPDSYEKDEEYVDQDNFVIDSGHHEYQQQWRDFYNATKSPIANSNVEMPERWKNKVNNINKFSSLPFITCSILRKGISSVIKIDDNGSIYYLKKSGAQGSQHKESKWLADSKTLIEEKFKNFSQGKYTVKSNNSDVQIYFSAITNPEQLWTEINAIEPVILELVGEYELSKSNTAE